MPKGLALKNSRCVSLTVKVKVPENKTLKQAVIIGADYKGYSIEKTVATEDGYLEFKVPKHGAATMIILTNNFKNIPAAANFKK